MSIITKLLKFILAFSLLMLTACITLPGHRVNVDESDFHLHIQAPSREIRESILFNHEKTKLIHLPENVRIELIVTDEIGKRRLYITRSKEAIIYHYELNGRKAIFGIKEQQWFASFIPKIVRKLGIINKPL